MSKDSEKPNERSAEAERQDESRRILERVRRESETIGASSLARVADRVAAHYRADDAPPDDAIEIWGKRIARILALIAFVALAYHLLTTYILPPG